MADTMRESDIINQIFSQALDQLQKRWQDGTAPGQTPQPAEQAAALPESSTTPTTNEDEVPADCAPQEGESPSSAPVTTEEEAPLTEESPDIPSEEEWKENADAEQPLAESAPSAEITSAKPEDEGDTEQPDSGELMGLPGMPQIDDLDELLSGSVPPLDAEEEQAEDDTQPTGKLPELDAILRANALLEEEGINGPEDALPDLDELLRNSLPEGATEAEDDTEPELPINASGEDIDDLGFLNTEEEADLGGIPSGPQGEDIATEAPPPSPDLPEISGWAPDDEEETDKAGAEADAGSDSGKENAVALKRNDEDRISDLPPDLPNQPEEEEDLDSLLEDLAKSADPDQEPQEESDELSGLSGLFEGIPGENTAGYPSDPDEEATSSAGTEEGHSLDDLLEHALGLADTPSEGEDNFPSLDGLNDADTHMPADEQESDEETFDEEGAPSMIEPSFNDKEDSIESDPAFSELLGSVSEDSDSIALSDDLFGDLGSGDDGLLPGQDLSSLLDGPSSDSVEPSSVVQVVEVPAPSVPLVEDADEELERKLAEMGLGADNLLHNRFSAGKEKLLNHLLQRFEALARHKLEPLPSDQVNLVRSVNLRVEIDLKFGEFSTTGNDDSLFRLDV